MKHQVSYKNFESDPRLEQILDRLFGRIDRLVSSFKPEAVTAHVSLERHTSRALVEAAVTLELPGDTLAAREEDKVPEKALREAFREVERQLKRYKSDLRRDRDWKRPAKREAVRREAKAEPAPVDEGKRLLVRDLVLANLDRVYNYSRREIAFRLATGESLPGDLTPGDVLDAVAGRAAREFFDRPADLGADRWLFQLVLQHLDDLARRLVRRPAGPGENVPGTLPGTRAAPEGTVAATGDEVADFFRPDEDLRLEDLAPSGAVPAPEEVRESRDLQRYVIMSLARLPRPWRDAFVLHHIEGLPIPETALVLVRPESDVRRSLEEARERLRRRIVESGLSAAA